VTQNGPKLGTVRFLLMQPKRLGVKVFVDSVVLDDIDASKPSAMTRTAWVNYLLQQGLASLTQIDRSRING